MAAVDGNKNTDWAGLIPNLIPLVNSSLLEGSAIQSYYKLGFYPLLYKGLLQFAICITTAEVGTIRFISKLIDKRAALISALSEKRT